MEMMNYDKINKMKSNVGLGIFLSFAVLGSSTVGYLLVTEKEDVLNTDAYKEVEIYKEEKIDLGKINHSTTTICKTDKESMYKSDIWLPAVTIDGVILEDINESIKEKFVDKYEALKEDSEDTLENAMLYKTRYVEYVNELEDTKILSLVIEEKILDAEDKEFSKRIYTYNIDMLTREVVYQDEIAPLVLGYDYRNIIKSAIKKHVIDNEYVQAEEYDYTYTGLEEYYILDGKFHFVLNPGDVFDKEYGIIDIVIEK